MPKLTTACSAVLLMVLLFGCDHQPSYKNLPLRGSSGTINEKLQMLLLKKTSFSLKERKQKLDSLQHAINPDDYSNYNLLLYLRGVLQENSNNSDSALKLYDKMLAGRKVDSATNGDLVILKSIGTISAKSFSWVDVNMINALQSVIRYAEKTRFSYVYEVYNAAAGIYYRFGDSVMPLHYLRLGYDNYPGERDSTFKGYYYTRMASCLLAAKLPDRAARYLDSAHQIAISKRDTVLLTGIFEMLAGIYGQQEDARLAAYYQSRVFDMRKRAGILSGWDWANQALRLYNQKKYREAVAYYQASLGLSRATHDIYAMQNAFGGLHAVYLATRSYDKALRYLDSSYEMVIAIFQKREAGKVADITLSYEREKKDEQIVQLNRQATLQARVLNQHRIIIGAMSFGIGAVIISAVVLFRQRKLKAENERLELAWSKLSMEQRLLRSQMDPHFIFNTLGALHGFLRFDEKEKALKYVNKFGKLLRVALENSRRDYVLLSEEIEAINNYLLLQQMRFEEAFEFLIDAYQGYREDNIQIPPMILQPFVENAILHGISQIDYRGKVEVVIRKQGGVIECTIEDNGRGMEEMKQHENHSLATVISEERLKGLSRETRQPASLKVIDKKTERSHGVRVELTIPYVRQTEATLIQHV